MNFLCLLYLFAPNIKYYEDIHIYFVKLLGYLDLTAEMRYTLYNVYILFAR